jgi:hypothetical protein
MKKVYFISGLGADKRIFSFLDLSFCEPVFVDWITPLKNESLQSYAVRLGKNIPGKDPVIIGISLGGMLATEIAKVNSSAKVIIISSNKTAEEFPFYLRIGKYLPIYKWLPDKFLKQRHALYSWIFGTKGEQEKMVLRQIIAESDMRFVKWSIDAILSWKNSDIPPNLVHIHGTADALLPYRFVKADFTIKNGKHVMPLDKHEEISRLLKKLVLSS